MLSGTGRRYKSHVTTGGSEWGVGDGAGTRGGGRRRGRVGPAVGSGHGDGRRRVGGGGTVADEEVVEFWHVFLKRRRNVR